MLNRIVVIGNGFDLAHGLKSSYGDFINWYWQEWNKKLKSSNLYRESDDLCIFSVRDESEGMSLGEKSQQCGSENFVDLIREGQMCNYRPQRLLSAITEAKLSRCWNGIESDYYNVLKHTSPTEEVQSINKQLSIIKCKLAEYLNLISSSTSFSIHDEILESILAPIKCCEVAVANTEILKDILEERCKYEEKDWKVMSELYGENRILPSFMMHCTEGLKSILRESDDYKNRIDESNQYLNFLRPNVVMLLSFNYTDVVAKYETERAVSVNYIHGRLSEAQSMIFGYGDEMDEQYKILEERNDNSYLTNIKSILYSESPNYRELLYLMEQGPYQVYIMGHSCGTSDRTLLNTLFTHRNCISIKPFYYTKEDGSDDYIDKVQNISRCFEDKELMRDRVVNKKYCTELLPRKQP